MLVNGKVWPYLNVEPRLYRLRVLNGCNARILNLGIGGVTMWQIGAEGGLFDAPVPVANVVLAPAERADLLVDFSALAGFPAQLKNAAPPRGVVTPAPQLQQVLQFNVAAGTPVAPTIPATLLGGATASLPDPGPAKRRYFTLNEFGVDTPGWRLTINGVGFDAANVDFPTRGDVEQWYYINLTGDTHPMHTHLFTFQVVGRVPFNAAAYTAAAPATPLGSTGIDPTPFFTGPMVGPGPTERGFKDTVKANPGQVTIIRMKFDLPSTASKKPQAYVHHCHIVEHEDNDMMRPFIVR
jgi:spore coat protein A